MPADDHREECMARKKRTRSQPNPPPAPAERPAVTAERFGRLYRLVRFLAEGPKTRERLTEHAGLDVRGFYRDLEVLRAFGIEVTLMAGNYSLVGDAAEAVSRLPFPDAHLTLGEVTQLGKGRTEAHAKLRERLAALTAG